MFISETLKESMNGLKNNYEFWKTYLKDHKNGLNLDEYLQDIVFKMRGNDTYSICVNCGVSDEGIDPINSEEEANLYDELEKKIVRMYLNGKIPEKGDTITLQTKFGLYRIDICEKTNVDGKKFDIYYDEYNNEIDFPQGAIYFTYYR